ncbi:MAG: type VI secretion system tube protein Hcp [Gemmataceae bacterium]|nr:type VI secretion system tube protein Hcp [Gemmataceae bacterium]
MAAVDYFLKLQGIDGDVTDDAHKNAIDLDSWSWRETQSGTHGGGGGGGAGKVQMQDFHCVAKMSKASPKLMLACATGLHIEEASLLCRKAGGKQQDYLTVRLQDVMITSYQTGGNGHGDIVPTDQFTMNFAKIEFVYRQQKPDGSLDGAIKTGYDQKRNVRT